MSIEIRCSRGRTLKAKDEHAGKSAKCPYCGNVIQVPVPTLEPNDPEPVEIKSFTLDIGRISDLDSYLSMKIMVEDDGTGLVVLIVRNPDSEGGAGAIGLGKRQFDELKELVSKTERVLANLQSTKRMKRMIGG
jgi:hypothetical protein